MKQTKQIPFLNLGCEPGAPSATLLPNPACAIRKREACCVLHFARGRTQQFGVGVARLMIGYYCCDWLEIDYNNTSPVYTRYLFSQPFIAG